MVRYNKETFIKKAIEKHSNKYDYSKVDYKDSLTKVCIICPEHGDFWQVPSAHLRGNICPKCANLKRGKDRGNTKDFIKKANEIHKDKYDYSQVNYVNATTPVSIICNIHGIFNQTPMNHLLGQGCPKCIGRGISQEQLIIDFNKIHNGKYDYSKVNFIKKNEKVCIICSKHGEFWQTPTKHLSGQGCPKCAIENRAEKHRGNTDTFIERATKLYGDRFDYFKVNYKSMDSKVPIICKKHGIFYMRPYDHLQGHICPKCGQLMSKAEDEIEDFIKSCDNSIEIIRNDRTILNGKEIDIYLPSLKIGIEYNGLKWHSEEAGKDCTYHINKLLEANQKGIKLYHIFEDEYINHKEIILSKIRHLIGCDNNLSKIYARKCQCKVLDKNEAKVFLEDNHIQGYGKCSVALGCFYNSTLIGVMCFLNENNGNWNLVRFASSIKFHCIGIGGKLFNYFIKNYNPLFVKTFADRRWTIDDSNNLYIKLGFSLDKTIKPDYRYIDIKSPIKRIHKFNLRKWALHKKYGLPMSYTEKMMVDEIGYTKIWDCGLYKYIWNNKSKD